MDDFLTKPIQAANLWAAIDRWAAKHSVGLSEPSLLDPAVLLATCGEDPTILESLCETFRARLPDHLQTVQQTLNLGNAAGLREAAHKLCSMISAFSTVVGETVSRLEDLAAQGDFAVARPLVDRLIVQADVLIPQTRNLPLAGSRKTLEMASAHTFPVRS